MTIIRIKQGDYDKQQMIRNFLQLQEDKHVTQATMRQHVYALNALHNGTDSVPTEKDLRRCLPPTMGNAYFNKRLNTYKQFFRMLISFGYCLKDPTENIRYKKQTFRVGNYEECNIKKFLSGFDTTTFSGLRNKVMALLIIDTGIRPSEVVELRTEDLLQSERVIRLRAEITKTRRERIVPVSLFVINKIRELKRYELEVWHNPYLFCTSDGNKMRTSCPKIYGSS